MTKRLNARLDDDLAEKLERLQRRTKKNVTEIVRESIELYARMAEDEPNRTRSRFESAGFVGCAEDDADLSASYKRLLPELARAKTDRR